MQEEGQKNLDILYSPALQRKVAINIPVTAGVRGMRQRIVVWKSQRKWVSPVPSSVCRRCWNQKKHYSKLDLSPAKSAETNETILISDLYGFLQDTQADSANTKCDLQALWGGKHCVGGILELGNLFKKTFWPIQWCSLYCTLEAITATAFTWHEALHIALVGKHTCLKPIWLFVLLRTTALTKS